MIPRLYFTESRFYSREYVGGGGLDSFFTGSRSTWEITRYKLVFYGVIAQEEGSHTLHLIAPGEKIVFVRDYREYCHWHNGPLDKRDNPLNREYCIREAVTETGYCTMHRNSLRAIYSKCFSSTGLESLRNCWLLDEKLGDRIEYVVYMLAYSHNRFKVGSTRSWRLYDRIGEQPHIVATILYRSRSAVKARDTEIRAGRLEWLTEMPHKRSVREVLKTPIPPVISRLEKMLLKTRRVLRIGDHEKPLIFRVEPIRETTDYLRAEEKRLDELIGVKLELIDYYAGYLLLGDTSTNQRYLLKANQILHMPILKTLS